VSGTGNVVGNNSIVTNNLYLTTNISVFEGEFQKYLGRPLNDEALKREIEQAIAQAVAGKSGESVRLFDKLSRKVPVPSIYNNLGVEYAEAGQTEKEARSAAGRRA
jgi:hypothetical protein